MSDKDDQSRGLIPWKKRVATPHPDDQDLVRRCREGDVEAADILFRRYHATAVKMAARESRSFDPEELASEALVRVWIAMRGGGGPQHAFPPYLKATIRNLAATWATQNREQPAEDEQLDAALSRANTEPGFESALSEHQVMMAAFDSLPERWRSVLWMTEVEGLKAAEVADRLGLTPNTAAALSKRARAALSRAWLQAHVERHADAGDECEWVLDRMAGYVRESLPAAQDERIREHVDACDQCAGAMRGVAHLGASLRVAVLVAGGSAASILAWSVGSGPTAAAATVTGGAAVGGPTPGKGLRRNLDRSGKAVVGAVVVILAVAAVAFAATGFPGFNLGDSDDSAAAVLPADDDGGGGAGSGGGAGDSDSDDADDDSDSSASDSASSVSQASGEPFADSSASSAGSESQVQPEPATDAEGAAAGSTSERLVRSVSSSRPAATSRPVAPSSSTQPSTTQSTPDPTTTTTTPVPGSVGGLIWLDPDGDGIQNDATPAAGVPVRLVSQSDTVIATVISDADGNYSFTNVTPGTYWVTVPTSYNGYLLTTQNQGGDDTLDSDPNPNGRTTPFKLSASQRLTSIDAGYADPETASIGDLTWYDANENLVQDPGEIGVDGITVSLYRITANGVLFLDLDMTDANGHYSFENLPAGTYQLQFDRTIDGPGYSFYEMSTNPGNIAQPTTAMSGMTAEFVLGAGEQRSDMDVAYILP